MTEQPRASFSLTDREHRWLTALLVLATVAAFFVVIAYVASLLVFFGDVILVFFLAWLLAFIISPIATSLTRAIPRLPAALAVILVYVALLALLLVVALQIAQALYTSISSVHWPSQQDLPAILKPWQDRLNSIGLGQVDLQKQGQDLLKNLQPYATGLVGTVQSLAFASLGVMGNLLLILILSLYMALDRDRILSFLFRLVPPAYSEEARLLETSISRSFGGFLRGQAVMGILYAGVAAAASLLLHLDYLPVTTAASGVLQAIPFFGPFVSWAPPVVVAALTKPEAILPTLIIMGVGWFVVMNIVQPRLMADAVGLHPIVVLGAVLVGAKLYGVPGAIFGIPVAAVCSAFFFFYLGHRSVETGTVAVRAAKRLEAREGRRVRIPREPQAGEDEEVEEARRIQARHVPGQAPGNARLEAAGAVAAAAGDEPPAPAPESGAAGREHPAPGRS